MKLVLLPLALLVVLARADNEDGVVYDAFLQTSSSVYMYQKYAAEECPTDPTVEVSQEAAVLSYNLDFSRAVAKTFQIEAAADYAAGTVTEIFVRLESETAEPIATVIVTDTSSTSAFFQFSADVSPSPVAGIHKVFFTFTGNAPNPILNLRNFQFFA